MQIQKDEEPLFQENELKTVLYKIHIKSQMRDYMNGLNLKSFAQGLSQLFSQIFDNQFKIQVLKVKIIDQDNQKVSEQIRVQQGYNRFFDNAFIRQNLIPQLLQNNYLSQIKQDQVQDKQVDRPIQKTKQKKQFQLSYSNFQFLIKSCQKDELPTDLKLQNSQFISRALNRIKAFQITILFYGQTLKKVDQLEVTFYRSQSILKFSSNIRDYIYQSQVKTHQGHQNKVNIKLIRQRQISLKLKNSKYQPIYCWSIGILTQGQKNIYNYETYFNTKQINNLLRYKYKNQIPETIPNLKSIIDQSNLQRGLVSIVTQMFDHFFLKTQIPVHSIDYYIVNQKNQFYIRINNPPQYSYFYNFQQAKDNQKKFSYTNPITINTWQRLPNFPLVFSQKIEQDNLNRIYLIRNSLFKIHFKKKTQLQKIIKSMKSYLIQQKIFNIKNQFLLKKLPLPSDQLYQLLKQDSIEYADIYQLLLFFINQNKIRSAQFDQYINLIEDNFQQKIALRSCLQKLSIQQGQISIMRLTKLLEQAKRGRMSFQLYNKNQNLALVRRVKLTPSGYIFLYKQPQMSNRILRKYNKQIDYFMRVSVQEDGGGKIIGKKKLLTYQFFRTKLNSIQLFKRKFIFLGWSPSQLRKFALWYVHQKQNFRKDQILNYLGIFDKDVQINNFKCRNQDGTYNQNYSFVIKRIYNPAKKAARIGQCFSASKKFRLQGYYKIYVAQDIKNKNGDIFSDGIGMISSDLIRFIQNEFKVSGICAVQVRYMGSKGILMLDPTLQQNSIVLRKSMIKYSCKQGEQDLDILEYNRFHKGFINRQIILLLATLGVNNKNFIQCQNQYIEHIKNASFRDCSIFNRNSVQLGQNIFSMSPIQDLIRCIINLGINLEQDPFIFGVLLSIKRKGLQLLRQKSNFIPTQSARLIGVLDQYGVLEQNEIFVSMNQSQQQLETRQYKILNQQKVVVTKNPCLHPGDIRIVKAIGKQQIIKRSKTYKGDKLNLWRLKFPSQSHVFQNCNNVIFFPKKGQRPLTAQISGGDLDGDMFFITWNKKLIPQQTIPAMKYDTGKPPQYSNVATDVQMLNFFVQYMNFDNLGKIDNKHLIQSDKSPELALSKQALQLAFCHASAVDFPKTGYIQTKEDIKAVYEYPDFFEKNDVPSYESTSILGILYRDVCKRSKEIVHNKKDVIVELFFEKIDLSIFQKGYVSQQVLSEAIQVEIKYSLHIKRLLNLFNIKQQFDIYTGNFNQKQSISKVISHVYQLKNYFTSLFFKNLQQDQKIFNQHTNLYLHVQDFSIQARKKIIFWNAIAMSAHLKKPIANIQGIETAVQFFKSTNQDYMLGICWFLFGPIMLNAIRCQSPQQEVYELPQGD